MSAEIAAVLDKAAEVIERRGWHQGDFMPAGEDPSTCGVCAAGAFNVAANDHPENDSGAATEAAVAFNRFIGTGTTADWNDAPERTPDEVIAALRAAAAAERAS